MTEERCHLLLFFVLNRKNNYHSTCFAGKSVGLVTTTRITHATPASAFAHTPERNWENDLDMTEHSDTEQCKDIARQLIEDNTDINVSMNVSLTHAYLTWATKYVLWMTRICVVKQCSYRSINNNNYGSNLNEWILPNCWVAHVGYQIYLADDKNLCNYSAVISPQKTTHTV